jgi:putative YhbY family RNA-binding protein
MKFELSPKKLRACRADAHHLDPVVMIGNDGLTPAVLHEIDLNLLSHGLIKIRVFSDDRATRQGFLDRIADELDAAPVQHIGKLLVVFRPVPIVEKAAPARRSRPVRGRPAAKTTGGKAVARPPRADRRPRPATGTGTGTRTAAVRGVPGRRRRTSQP